MAILLMVPSVLLAQVPASQDGIFLLEPIGGVGVIPVGDQEFQGLGPVFFYFNLIYPWFVGLGAAVALLHATWGGVEIIQSGADTGKRDSGKNRLLISLGGLLLILLSPTILNTINPTFFK